MSCWQVKALNLTQEEQNAQDRAEGPGQLDNDGHLDVGRFMHSVGSLEMEVGHGLGVGEDAGGDHEGQHVHRDQEHRAHRKGEKQPLESGYHN